jgi:hypothetical protein
MRRIDCDIALLPVARRNGARLKVDEPVVAGY